MCLTNDEKPPRLLSAFTVNGCVYMFVFVAECVCDHGKCEDGLAGSGRCVCYKGWKGASCSAGKTHTNTPSRAH